MSCAALISIHPEHANSIMLGKKTYEYRKVLPKRDISSLVLYCTAPVKKIIAMVEVKGRLVASLLEVWNDTSHGSGISYSSYSEYYSGRQNASALILGSVHQMKSPMDLSDLPGRKTSPQSFYYLDDKDMEAIVAGLLRKPGTPNQESRRSCEVKMSISSGVHAGTHPHNA